MDYSDFIESIMDELDDPDADDPPCPVKCGKRVNPSCTSSDPEKRHIEITQRAYEVLKIMVEGNSPENFPFVSETISEWIMEEWAGYCDANGEPDVEIG